MMRASEDAVVSTFIEPRRRFRSAVANDGWSTCVLCHAGLHRYGPISCTGQDQAGGRGPPLSLSGSTDTCAMFTRTALVLYSLCFDGAAAHSFFAKPVLFQLVTTCTLLVSRTVCTYETTSKAGYRWAAVATKWSSVGCRFSCMASTRCLSPGPCLPYLPTRSGSHLSALAPA